MTTHHTILAIDDSKKILDIIKYFLEQEGYTVKAVPDPIEGIKTAKEGGIDLILLDIMMPGMDGYTVCDSLKKDEKTRDIPVIMLTAKAIILHTPKDFFYGLYGFLAKPFSKQQLTKVVSEALRLTKASEEPRGFISNVEGEGEAEPKSPGA
ncbi:MAG TPA: response regulator [Planctomycetota bacterium]|nr:response regulator [Planctomycetota bacterium]